MAPIVIDASIGVSIVRAEPEGPAAKAVLAEAVDLGSSIVVPSHFWLEVTNALISRHRWPGSAVVKAIHDLDELEVQTIDLDRAVLLSAIDFAERHGLTPYDAIYLGLAHAVNGSVMTLDIHLRAAAGERAISPDARGRLSETRALYEHDVTWPKYRGASAYLAKLRAEALREASN